MTTLMPEGFRTMPHDIESEQAVLGAIMINNEAYHAVNGIIDADSFYEPVHRQIFRCMAEVIDQGNLANDRTLRAKFADHPSLKEINGARYLADMARAAETILNAPDYARVIREMACRRAIIETATDASNAAYEIAHPATPAAEIAATMADRISSIFVGSTDDEIVSGRKVLHDLLSRLEKGFKPHATGVSYLDRSFGGGLRPGSLYAFEGKAKRFKTGILSAIHQGIWSSGRPSLFITLELSPLDIVQRSMAGNAGVSYLQVERPENRNKAINAGFEFESKHDAALDRAMFAHVPGASFPRLLSLCSKSIIEHHCEVILIDYWQRVPKHNDDKNQSQHLEAVANGLADFAAKHNVAIVLASQLNRQDESLASSGLERACAWRGKINTVYIPGSLPNLQDTGIWIEVSENRYGGSMDIGSEDEPAFVIAPGPVLMPLDGR